jgi:hypothetical protein
LVRLLGEKGTDIQAKDEVSAVHAGYVAFLPTTNLLYPCLTAPSLVAGRRNAARCCQERRHQRVVPAACRGKGTNTIHYYTYNPHTPTPHPPTQLPSSDVPVSTPPRPLTLPLLNPPLSPLTDAPMLHVLCPFVQRLIDAANRGDVEAVRTLLNRPARNVAGFINGGGKVRAACCYWSCSPLSHFPNYARSFLCLFFAGGASWSRMETRLCIGHLIRETQRWWRCCWRR